MAKSGLTVNLGKEAFLILQFLLHPANYWSLFIPGYDFQKDFIYFASRNPGPILP
jgi:hypothetical protein